MLAQDSLLSAVRTFQLVLSSQGASSVPTPFWTHSGLDGFKQQDGLFVFAGSLSEPPLLDQRVALHVEKRHRLQLLVFFHHP